MPKVFFIIFFLTSSCYAQQNDVFDTFGPFGSKVYTDLKSALLVTKQVYKLNLSYQKMQYFTNQHVGNTREVLFETHNKNGMMEGYTDNYIKITTPFKKEWENNIVPWKI
jgi:hypothetical protein